MLVIVVVVPPDVICDDAVMLTAPTESLLAALKMTEATPVPPLPVKSVAEVGINATRPLVAAKVTAPYTSVPLASLSVAVAVTGFQNDTTLEERVKVKEGWPVIVVLLPVSVPVPSLLPRSIRQ